MNKAESVEEVKKVFTKTVEELLKDVLDKKVVVKAEDLTLLPDSEPLYRISDRLQEDERLKSYWTQSDLPHVIHRLAESASGRHRHLEKHPEKTEAKIRM
jgi:hypothetical protein